jgi:hypothetical protein
LTVAISLTSLSDILPYSARECQPFPIRISRAKLLFCASPQPIEDNGHHPFIVEKIQSTLLLVPALEDGCSACAICDKIQYLLRIALCELAVRIEVAAKSLPVTRHVGKK